MMRGGQEGGIVSSIAFGLLAVCGLFLAALAAGCPARPPAPENPSPEQVDPQHADTVEPGHPLGDGGPVRAEPLPRPTAPTTPPEPRPQPMPEPSPIPDRNPEPVPEPSPVPPGAR